MRNPRAKNAFYLIAVLLLVFTVSSCTAAVPSTPYEPESPQHIPTEELSELEESAPSTEVESPEELVASDDSASDENANSAEEEIYDPVPRKVAFLTIDDGPSRNITSAMLDILKEEGIPATFFVLPHKGGRSLQKDDRRRTRDRQSLLFTQLQAVVQGQ